MLKFDVLNRFSGKVQFTAEIDCSENETNSIKLGLAVKWAVTTRAYLTGAYLSGADMTRADMTRADMTRADLTRANLTGAYLTGANLTGANLTDANLTGADMTGANLTRAYLTDANLTGAKFPQITILPEGDLIGWKKLKNGIIAKLQIPASAKRVNSTGRKCRAEFVTTLALYKSHQEFSGVGIGIDDETTKYEIGNTTFPDKFDPDFRVECSNGIHFFITREEAEAY